MESVVIKDKSWRTFEEEKPPHEEVVWLKLKSGNIVLSVLRNNGMGSIGWWAVSIGETGSFMVSTNNAYIAREAQWQPCNFKSI